MADLSDVASIARPARGDALALVAGLVTVVAWGSAFVGIRAAGAELSPGALALGRLIVSGGILTAVAVVRRERVPQRRELLGIAIYGVLWLALYSTTLNAAERSVDAGTAAMLINTGPILIAILAGIFLKEGFPPRLFAGCAVAFMGCLLISYATAGFGRSVEAVGIVLCLVAAVAYAAAVVVQKPVLARASPFQVTWLGGIAGLIALVPFGPTLAQEAPHVTSSALLWTIYLGAIPTALGFATWTFALRRTSAGRMASLAFLIPVVAIVLGWLLLGEAPPWLALAGGALCVGGVYLARR